MWLSIGTANMLTAAATATASLGAEPTGCPPRDQRERSEQQGVDEAEQGQLPIGGHRPATDPPFDPEHGGHGLVVERWVLGHLVDLPERRVAPFVVPSRPRRLVGRLAPRMEAGRGERDRLALARARPRRGRVGATQADDGRLVPKAVVVGVGVAVGQVEHEGKVGRFVGRLTERCHHRPRRTQESEGQAGSHHHRWHGSRPRRPGRFGIGHEGRAYRWRGSGDSLGFGLGKYRERP